jgi:acetoin utilization protein AcuB
MSHTSGKDDATATVVTEPTACEVMTSQLLVAQPGTTVTRAWRAVVTAGVRHLPVLVGSRCIGLLTEDDLARNCAQQRVWDMDQRLAEILRRPPPAVRPDDSLDRVAETMRAGGAEAVVVVNAAEHLVGLITCQDLVSAYSNRT